MVCSFSPTPLAPLVEVWSLSADGAVVTVPRVEPRFVVVGGEHPLDDVAVEGVEALAGVLGVADTTGKDERG